MRLLFESLLMQTYSSDCCEEKKHIFSYKAMQIPLGQNRKRGRPANTTTALLMQPGESLSINGTATSASYRDILSRYYRLTLIDYNPRADVCSLPNYI